MMQGSPTMFLIDFFKRTKGVVTIEFAVALVAMFSITFFALDTGMYILEKNKLERTNYSLISLIRERTRLYNNENTVTQIEVNNLTQATKLLIGSALVDNLKIRVDGIYFDEYSPQSQQTVAKTVSLISQQASTLTDSACFDGLSPINDLKKYSVWVDPKGWTTVFRVTICAPNRNNTPFVYFQPGDHPTTVLVTSSVGILR
jgi:tight adherence protein F